MVLFVSKDWKTTLCKFCIYDFYSCGADKFYVDKDGKKFVLGCCFFKYSDANILGVDVIRLECVKKEFLLRK